MIDLLEHLRHLMLVQHMGEVPDSLPVTEETRERLRAQANQLGEATVVRLCDLLAVAVDDLRQGGDPRLPLELALVKVTRPAADLSRESMAYRLEQLEHAPARRPRPRHPAPPTSRAAPPPEERAASEAAAARARAAPGGVAADDRLGGRAEVDADRRRPPARPSGRALRRDAHRRVPGERVVPPPARRGPEERRPAPGRALRGDRAAGSRWRSRPARARSPSSTTSARWARTRSSS